MKHIYYRQEEGNSIKEKISKTEVIKLLEAYDTWTKKNYLKYYILEIIYTRHSTSKIKNVNIINIGQRRNK